MTVPTHLPDASVQMDLLSLLESDEAQRPDLAALVARRIFASHERRYELLRHRRGDIKRDVLVATIGEHHGGSGRVDDELWFSWTATRSGVDVDWTRGAGEQREHLPWPVVVEAALDGLSPSEAAALDAAETARRATRAAAEAKFARLALHDDAGNPVLWVAPWDTSSGLKAGTAVPGARCWLCGDIEPGEHILTLNHGLAPYHPESLDRTTCTMQDRAVRRAAVKAAAA